MNGTARFASLQTLCRAARKDLAGYVGDDGTVSFAAPAHIVSIAT